MISFNQMFALTIYSDRISSENIFGMKRKTFFILASVLPSAQQRVLQKMQHVVEFAGEPMVLTLQDNPGPNISSNKANPTPEKLNIPKQDSASPQVRLKTHLDYLTLICTVSASL